MLKMQIIQESTFNSYNPKDVIEIEADTFFYNAPKLGLNVSPTF